jgi:hypothetical protein
MRRSEAPDFVERRNAATNAWRSFECRGDHLIRCNRMRDSRRNFWTIRRSSMALRVSCPCFSAFWLPSGAPDPGAPPCIRQRFFPLTAGHMQGLPERVLSPMRRMSRKTLHNFSMLILFKD